MWLACFDQCFVTVITIILLFHRRSIKTGKQDLFNITFQKSIPLSPKIFPCKNPKSKWNKTYFVNGEQLPTLILLKNSNMSSHFWLANEMAISNSFVMNVIYDWPIIVGWPLAKFFALFRCGNHTGRGKEHKSRDWLGSARGDGKEDNGGERLPLLSLPIIPGASLDCAPLNRPFYNIPESINVKWRSRQNTHQ